VQAGLGGADEEAMETVTTTISIAALTAPAVRQAVIALVERLVVR
jgi:hypothetical protein